MTRRQELTSRIRSVKSIQKTTRVMQMISASKFRAARTSLIHARKYCERVQIIIGGLDCVRAEGGTAGTLLLVFSSDRGLCGGFNHSIVKVLREYICGRVDDNELSLLFVGKKAHDAARSFIGGKAKVLGVVPQPKHLSYDDFKGMIYKFGVDITGFGSVLSLYCKFNSISLHEPMIEEVLYYGREGSEDSERMDDEIKSRYDPCLEAVSRRLWINSMMGKIYLYLCESVTCEHCSRMISMESANSNTQSMLKKLVLDYNRSRQAAITGDLIEIVSGCEAAG